MMMINKLITTILVRNLNQMHGIIAKSASPVVPLQIAKRITATKAVNRTLVRQEPGLVRLGFVPDEWFTLFFPKTGVSGFGTFVFTFSTFLISKEYYVLEHDYYEGLSMLILCVMATKYVGPLLAKLLDKEIDNYESAWNSVRGNEKKNLEAQIENEGQLQWSSEGQLMLVEAKRQNVALQLEAVYRERLMHAYIETKKRLDYCVIRKEVEAAIIRRTMVNWIVKEVEKNFDDKLEKEAINKCLEDLKVLAKTYENLKIGYDDPLLDSVDDKDKPK